MGRGGVGRGRPEAHCGDCAAAEAPRVTGRALRRCTRAAGSEPAPLVALACVLPLVNPEICNVGVDMMAFIS